VRACLTGLLKVSLGKQDRHISQNPAYFCVWWWWLGGGGWVATVEAYQVHVNMLVMKVLYACPHTQPVHSHRYTPLLV
jgi:hypothetical protein